MTKVLFASTFFYKLDPKQWSFKQPYPPLGTMLAASVIRNENFEVALFDASLASDPKEITGYLEKENPSYLVIYDDGFNYLTKMCLTVMREAAFIMAGIGKKYGCTIIVCSSDATDHYEKYFRQGAHYVLLGEGEETLKELLHSLEEKKPVNEIKGLGYVSQNETIVTSERPVMRNLDELPMAAWDLVNLDEYRNIWLVSHGYFSLNMATTRGCPFKCNWCAKPIYGNRYNVRSPQHVIHEIEYLLQTHKPDHFWMCDDIFGLKPNWVQQFRTEVKKRGLKFKYKIQSRVDLLLQSDTVDALAESGAETVWVGAESGSQKVLDAMEKGTSVVQIYNATKLLKQNGIKVSFFLQFGYPGEEKPDIDATLKMLDDLMPDDIGISVSYPLPGTKFYERVKSELTKKQNWNDSDDMALMFKNTYPSSFYKLLYRYVHGRYRLKRGLQYLSSWIKKPRIGIIVLKKMLSVPYYLCSTRIYGFQLRKAY